MCNTGWVWCSDSIRRRGICACIYIQTYTHIHIIEPQVKIPFYIQSNHWTELLFSICPCSAEDLTTWNAGSLSAVQNPSTGSSDVWTCLNRLRTTVGRHCWDNLQKLGYVTFDDLNWKCGKLQAMEHLLVCPPNLKGSCPLCNLNTHRQGFVCNAGLLWCSDVYIALEPSIPRWVVKPKGIFVLPLRWIYFSLAWCLPTFLTKKLGGETVLIDADHSYSDLTLLPKPSSYLY